MKQHPRLLDLYSGAGGAAYGYILAGFHCTGVDIQPQPRYRGNVFVQADALEYLAAHGQEYDVIHASPPCQGYSRMRHLPWLRGKTYPLLLEQTHEALEHTGAPYVLENVADAPLDALILCGQMFDLQLYRHRRFASNRLLLTPTHLPHKQKRGGGRFLNKRYSPGDDGMIPIVTVAGHTAGMMKYARAAMGIDWMTRDELTQAIPPAYTEWIGKQLLAGGL